MGAAGQVITFVTTLAAVAFITPFVLGFAAHCYLVVMQDTTAGLDRVVWPEEPFQDWFGRAAYLGGLALVWLAPAGILSRIFSSDLFPADPGLRFLVFAVPGMWLLFPIGLLSSLSTVSRTHTLRPAIVLGLFRIFPSMIGFYLFTGLLLAGSAALWHRALFLPGVLLLPVAAGVGGAVVLIHARLLGRIAWLLQQLEGKSKKSAPVKVTRPARVVKAKRYAKTRGVKVQDPWAQPAQPQPAADVPKLPVEGYGVEVEGQRKQEKRKEKVELPVEGYDVAEPAAPPTPLPAPEPISAAVLAHEVELRDRTPPNDPPAWPLFSGVYTFPFYESSMRALLWMGLGGVAIGAGVRTLISTWPF